MTEPLLHSPANGPLTNGVLGLSNTEMGQWKRCPRRWFVEHYLGFLPADEKPFGKRQLGIRMHTALEGWYGPRSIDPKIVLDLIYNAEITAHPDDEKELRAEWELAILMATGYLDWVQNENADATLQVVAVEQEVAVPLPGFEGRVALRCKMDQIGLDTATGYFHFIDHKTVENFERVHMLRMDPQMKTYNLVQWLKAGYPPPQPGVMPQIRPDAPLVLGGQVNMLRRIKRSARAKPPFYERSDPFRYGPDSMAATLAGIQQVAYEILQARAALDQAYAAGGTVEAINHVQRTICRPVEIMHDCSWSCPHAGGLCIMMSDGSDWAGVLEESGRYVRADPYDRYNRGGLEAIQAQAGRQQQ